MHTSHTWGFGGRLRRRIRERVCVCRGEGLTQGGYGGGGGGGARTSLCCLPVVILFSTALLLLYESPGTHTHTYGGTRSRGGRLFVGFFDLFLFLVPIKLC